MKILVDENIPAAQACFGQLGEVVRMPGRHLAAADVRDADALIVRSITRVTPALLSGSKVRFVGTATIGVDHIDLDYLRSSGIAFASAPGCNAQSVAEYVMTALLELEASRGLNLRAKSVGIFGLGNVGSRLKTLCEAFGLQVLACDPPLQAQGVGGLVSADEVWQADIVSFHVPLLKGGFHPTYHLANEQRLRTLKPDAVLINTARGDVVDNCALSRVLQDRPDLSVVLDVWENEPLIDVDLACQVNIATPHIAGYSHDGKVRGTWMIYRALCEFLQLPVTVSEAELIPASLQRVLDLQAMPNPAALTARDLVRQTYPILEDDQALRASLLQGPEQRALAFDGLRKHYPVRREFASVLLQGLEQVSQLQSGDEGARLRALGFRLG